MTMTTPHRGQWGDLDICPELGWEVISALDFIPSALPRRYREEEIHGAVGSWARSERGI